MGLNTGPWDGIFAKNYLFRGIFEFMLASAGIFPFQMILYVLLFSEFMDCCTNYEIV